MVETPKLICIVDDDRSVRRALGRLTRSFGFDVKTIASGRECLDGAYIDRADCLVLDVSMPGMDGFELYTRLQESGRGVPTVFISSDDDEDYDRKARSLGAIEFLSKPCDQKSLVEAINKAISSKDTPGENGIH